MCVVVGLCHHHPHDISWTYVDIWSQWYFNQSNTYQTLLLKWQFLLSTYLPLPHQVAYCGGGGKRGGNQRQALQLILLEANVNFSVHWFRVQQLHHGVRRQRAQQAAAEYQAALRHRLEPAEAGCAWYGLWLARLGSSHRWVTKSLQKRDAHDMDCDWQDLAHHIGESPRVYRREMRMIWTATGRTWLIT